MKKNNGFFFSKIANMNVYNISGQIIGSLNDLVMNYDTSKPTIKAIEIKNEKRFSYVSATSLEIHKYDKDQYRLVINSNNIGVESISEDDTLLARDFLDKQIVDINGKKVVRVNDVRMGYINKSWMLLAVDVGFRGLLRRMGIEKIGEKAFKLFKKEFRNSLIYWDNVEPINASIDKVKLATSMSKITMLHAADIADIIEELDIKSREAIFNSLDDEKAAEVLEEVEQDIQMSLIENLPDEKVSEILEIMPSDEAADILEEIDDKRAERLLISMEAENSDEIRELMEYEEKTVGSIMAVDFISFLPDIKVSDATEILKVNKPKGDMANTFFVINNRGKLLGTVSPVELLAAGQNEKIYDIMIPNIAFVKDEDSIDDALELMSKYGLFVLPVMDETGEMVGIISINDLIYELVRLRRLVA